MSILNLTQHTATPEQLAVGVVDLPTHERRSHLQGLLTFAGLPSRDEVEQRAKMIARLAEDGPCERAMIGGAPYLMAPLERALLAIGITPVYAFSVRDTAEERQPDGSVRKVNVFRHAGWVPA